MPRAAYVPQLATLVTSPPTGEEWLHEIKLDGYRIGCLVRDGSARLFSRTGLDWTRRFPEVAEAAARLPVRDALLDGELVVLRPDGRSSFESLQQVAGGGGDRASLAYFAFDLLALDGERVARLPLDERKKRLKTLLGRTGQRGRVRYTDHLDGSGETIMARACAMGLEGIVSKRRDLPYRPGRTDAWRKAKCLLVRTFVVGGYTDQASAGGGLGALLVGHYADARLTFAGRVGTGFTQQVVRDLLARLTRRSQRRCPFEPAPTGALARSAHWVAPTLVCDVAFTEWTSAGVLRHPTFRGLRTDVDPSDVHAG